MDNSVTDRCPLHPKAIDAKLLYSNTFCLTQNVFVFSLLQAGTSIPDALDYPVAVALDASGIEPSRPAGGKSKSSDTPLGAEMARLGGITRTLMRASSARPGPHCLPQSASNDAFACRKIRPRLRLRLTLGRLPRPTGAAAPACPRGNSLARCASKRPLRTCGPRSEG